MTAGNKKFRLRGGVDGEDFPPRNISLKDVRAIGRIAWEKWGGMAADRPIRELIALAYAEGLYHGSMIIARNPDMLASTNGSSQGGASSVAAPASSSSMSETKTLSVRDLLESL